MTDESRITKAVTKEVSDELVRLGWTLRKENRIPGQREPYDYLLEWLHEADPVHIDWDTYKPLPIK